MPNINKIKLSGTTYSIQDENACKVVELTQAEYDELPTTAKTSNSLFVITDATAGDLSNYYTKTETDNAITSATSTKQDTLVSGTNIKTINGETLLGEGNITIQGGSGSGKAIEAGTNISITTGETADTINCTLPITAGTNSDGKGIIIGDSECTAKGLYAISLGHSSKAGGNYSFCNGSNSSANGSMSFSYGDGCNSMYNHTLMFGFSNRSTNPQQYSFGSYLNPKNELEFSFGKYNNSYSASTTFGHSGNTLFSIGNGYDFSSTHNWHNALEIRQNGDIYIANTNDTSITGDKAYSLYPMIKLQDALGGGGSITVDQSLDSGSTNAVANSAITNAINSKMDEVNFANFYGNQYSAGLKGYYYDSQTETQTEKFNWGMVWQSDGSIGFDGLGNLAVFNKIDTSAITTTITSSSTDAQVPSAKAVNDKLGGLKLVKLTQSEYDSLTTKDNSTLYVIVN